MRRFACLLLTGVLACNGDEGDDTDTPSSYPSCAAGEIAIEGTVDGADVSARFVYDGSYAWVNDLDDEDEEPGTLDIHDAANGALHLEWFGLLANGASTDARGFVDLSPSGGPNYGNCETQELTGTITAGDDGVPGTFVLRDVRAAPYCEQDALEGEIVGCWTEPEM